MGPDTEFKGGRLLGRLSLSDAKRLIERFEKENLTFRVEADDSGLKKMNAIIAKSGGAFGETAALNIYVANGSFDRARKLLDQYVEKYCRI